MRTLGFATAIALITLILAACSGGGPSTLTESPAPTPVATVAPEAPPSTETQDPTITPTPVPTSTPTAVPVDDGRPEGSNGTSPTPPATTEVSAIPGCDEQIHECVLDDFSDIWYGYSGISSSEGTLGRINLYFYTGAIYPDDKDVEWNKAFEYLHEAERVLPRIERRMGVSFTGDLYIMIYENWNAMKHFAPNPEVELPSLILGRDTLVINHDHDDVVGTIQREIGRMVQEALTVDEGPASTTPTPVPTSTPAPSRETSTETDREALIVLYEATDGPNWSNNENWLSDRPIRDWHGVETDASGRVVGLYLFGNQLSGKVPPELGSLSNLRLLQLPDNQLSGDIPPELGNLSNLTFLTLFGNQLSGDIPPELGSLPYLDYLGLSGNQLSGEIPAELGNLSNLTGLELHDNQLSGEMPPELGNLSNLVALHLSSNQLSGEIPSELGNLSNLAWLALYDNQLSGDIPPELGSLPYLKGLQLWSNQLTGQIPPELANLSQLTWLHLSGNQLSGCIPTELLDLQFNDLAMLHLPYCG